MDRDDVNQLLFQFKNGYIDANKFAQDMKRLNYTLPQIIQIIDAANRLPGRDISQIPVPPPAGVVQDSAAPASSFSTTLPGPGQTAPAQQGTPRPLVLPPEAGGPTPQTSGAPSRDQVIPAASDQPYYGMGEFPVATGDEQRFRPMPQPSAPAQRAVSTARQTLPAAPQQQPSATPEERTGMLTRLVRGDFREGADQRVMEAMRRQREESGMAEGRASGGQVESKKASRDDVLNKALDIIHTMLTRR